MKDLSKGLRLFVYYLLVVAVITGIISVIAFSSGQTGWGIVLIILTVFNGGAALSILR
jgi:hypothetical protein